MNLQSGRRDKFDYNARFNVRRRIEKNDFRFEARRYFGESDQGKTTDRMYSNFRWRRDLSPGVFYQTDTLYSSDAIKEIDVNLEQTLGLGYRLLNQKALKVSTGAGLSGRYREDNVDNGNTNYLLDVFQDLDYRLGSRLRFTQEFRIALPPDERSEYEYEFQAGMVSKVTDSLHLSIRYQLEYDRSLPEDRREDQRIVSSVGIDF
jgi:putative salt-induced outer membrane protein YdiY